VLALTSAVVCAATGIAWATVDDTEGFGLFLLMLSLLGGSALAACGWWQVASGPKTRAFVIVLLAALAGGYVAANTMGLLLTGNAPFDVGAVPALSWLGLVVGALLYVASLWGGLSAIRERGRALGDEAAA
jgi:hypothetical protein